MNLSTHRPLTSTRPTSALAFGRARATLAALAAAALALAVAACGDDGNAPGALGDSCAPDDANACATDLVCDAVADGTFICAVPLGGLCDLEATEPYCASGAACTPVTDVEGNEAGQCLVPEAGVCDPEAPFCAPGLVCDPRDDDVYGCYRPIRLRGTVVDSTDDAPIEGARVIALDDESVAVTDVATSDAEGAYTLEVPAVRDATSTEGEPVSASYTLRAQADAYQSFPGGLRTALPINTSEAVLGDEAWVIESALTTVALIPLPDQQAARYAIAGNVVATEGEAGVLVVAEGGGEAYTAITDRSGGYVIFNLPPGQFEVAGYAADLQLERVDVTIVDADLGDVDLTESEAPLSDVSGSIQLVNDPGGSQTSVILVVASTFQNAFGRGETPRGLRAPRSGPPNVTGAWEITGVPDGTYVILAAFENDDLVRDPDLNIGGTATLTLALPDAGGTSVTAGSFKVTEALDVIGPGTDVPEAVTSAPDLVWQNDTSEDWYEVRVFDAFGNNVWEDLQIDSEPGQSPPISVTYGGPLESGMYYQFRALSWRQPSNQDAFPISATEDLRGVFFVPPEE